MAIEYEARKKEVKKLPKDLVVRDFFLIFIYN